MRHRQITPAPRPDDERRCFIALRHALTVASLVATLVAFAAGAASSTQPAPHDEPDEKATFLESELLSGSRVDEAPCRARPNHVWARDGAHAACLRYWVAGLPPSGPRHVMVYLTGDAISNVRAQPAYVTRSPASMRQFTEASARELGVPFLLLARPGTYGSSGDHRERRRAAEARLVSAALDELRARFDIDRLAVVGFSGGGHVAASLIAWRADLSCVVLASSVSSPRQRWQAKGLTRDVTGFDDSVEPAALYAPPLPSPGLRVRIVGDPRDTNTPWPTQTPIAMSLRSFGVDVEQITSNAEDPERHDVSRHARALARDCMALR